MSLQRLHCLHAYISLSYDNKVSLKVFSMPGHLVQNQTSEPHSCQIPLSFMEEGVGLWKRTS